MDKEIRHPDSPKEEFVAPATRNAVGRKPSAGSACKDYLSCRNLHPPQGGLCPVIDGAGVKVLVILSKISQL